MMVRGGEEEGDAVRQCWWNGLHPEKLPLAATFNIDEWRASMVAARLEVVLVCVRGDSGLDYLVNNKTINTFFVQALQKVGI